MIIVTSKTDKPFSQLDLPNLAKNASLILKHEVTYDANAYPLYENKRGVGNRAKDTFKITDAVTYAFARDLN